jgi:phosphate starvation-inducible protein PhoH|tara:strand:- start:7194 stop:7940 length:747 start_codon:yes stop_codon:yes gene_type:complete
MSRNQKKLQIVEAQTKQKRNSKQTPRIDDLVVVDPLTTNQKLFFTSYKNSIATLLHGSAGTGKTFIALYKALEEVLEKTSPYEKLVVCRSAVASRDIGHLPGTELEKTEVYMRPYVDICESLFPDNPTPFQLLQESSTVDWMITSFIRGITLDNAIIVVDECQNMNDMEMNSIMTRVGQNSKVIFCGDFRQSDLYKNRSDLSGLQKFMVIAESMPSFNIIEFGTDDIVRSELVKEYIIARQEYEEKYT